MLKRIAITVAVTLALSTLPGAVVHGWAQGQAPTEADQTGAQSRQPDYGRTAIPVSNQSAVGDQERTIQGTIQKVDSVGNNLTVRTNNDQEQTLTLDANTSVKLNGKAAAVADLKTGQQATVTLSGQKAVAVDVADGPKAMR
jgi:hypothetical protein